jgi:drug/metabolite transporter (DMT)-like permease
VRTLDRDLVVVACAVSAGIHGALVPSHFDDGVAAGLGFAASAAVLAGLAAGLARRASRRLVDAAILTLAGLIGAYALAATTGIPLLHPEPEPVDGLAVATKAVEALGLLAALNLKGTLSWPERTRTVRFHLH